MFAIQPLTLPNAAQMLLAIDPAAEPAGDAAFEAQFSALMAAAGPSATQPEPANAPARPALPGPRGGKDETESDKLPGKQGGNILPDALAPFAAPQGEDDADPSAPEPSAGASAETAPAPATLTVQLLLAQISAPAQQAIAPGAAAAALPAATATGPEDARPARWLAMASTAPATATSAMPGALTGGAALPPAANGPVPPAQSPTTAEPPEASAPAIPAIRIPLAIALPTGLTPRQPQGEIDADIAVNQTLTPPAPPVPAVLQPVVQAQAASLAVVQQSATVGGAAAPTARPDVPSAQTTAQTGTELASAGIEAPVAAPQSFAPPAAAPFAASTSAAIQPHDFAALIDRLVEARQTVQASLTSQTVQASIQHAEFGRVSLAFQQDPAGLTVSLVSPDPDLARAVQNLVPAAMSADSGAASQRQDGQRQDWQGGGAATSGQPQGQLSAQQQRGQSPQRETTSGAAAHDHPAGTDDDAPASARGGIFA